MNVGHQRRTMEVPATQAPDADVVEEYDATQPAEDAAAFAATQPADDARPAGAHFTREGDGGGAPAAPPRLAAAERLPAAEA